MLNTSHPDCIKFREEFESLKQELEIKLKSTEKPKGYGKDGISTKIYKEFNLKFKALKKKYHYLYED